VYITKIWVSLRKLVILNLMKLMALKKIKKIWMM
jgi:hypothetical protein